MQLQNETMQQNIKLPVRRHLESLLISYKILGWLTDILAVNVKYVKINF